MEIFGYVYKITFPDGDTYIGVHKYPVEKLDEKYFGSGSKLKNKYKIFPKKIEYQEILDVAYSSEELYDLESQYILMLEPSLNILVHQATNPMYCEESRLKIKSKLKGRKFDDAWKNKIRKSLLGKKQSVETTQKRSAAMKKWYLLHPEHKNTISKVHTGKDCSNRKPHSKESRKRQGETLKNRLLKEPELLEKFRKQALKMSQDKERNKKNSEILTGYRWINNGVERRRLLRNQKLPEGFSYGIMIKLSEEQKQNHREACKKAWEKRRMKSQKGGF